MKLQEATRSRSRTRKGVSHPEGSSLVHRDYSPWLCTEEERQADQELCKGGPETAMSCPCSFPKSISGPLPPKSNGSHGKERGLACVARGRLSVRPPWERRREWRGNQAGGTIRVGPCSLATRLPGTEQTCLLFLQSAVVTISTGTRPLALKAGSPLGGLSPLANGANQSPQNLEVPTNVHLYFTHAPAFVKFSSIQTPFPSHLY